MAGVEWVKLYTDIFENRKIKALRALCGDAGFTLWIHLLCMAAEIGDDGRLCNPDGSVAIDSDLSIMTGEPLQVVKTARPVMERLRLLERDEQGILVIAGWIDRQSVDKLTEIRRMSAERSRNYRQRKAQETKELEELRHAPSRDVT